MTVSPDGVPESLGNNNKRCRFRACFPAVRPREFFMKQFRCEGMAEIVKAQTGVQTSLIGPLSKAS